MKPCAHCQTPFNPQRMGQRVCGPLCASRYVKAAKKAEAVQTRERKAALKTIPQLIKEAQHAFNAYIRQRDEGKDCICCPGTPLGGPAVGGAAGVLYASKNLYIAPEMFTLNVSILILACVVFGGIGNIWGVIVGATILGYLPDRIRFISDARLLVFGVVLVVVMNFRPDGLLPRKKREKAIVKREANA